MAQPYVGEIRMFAGNFAPAGWMFCEGQLLPISENETLFNLIGTTYGGDGQSTFALPDLRGRVPIHQGNGFILAETGGAEEITLTVSRSRRTATRCWPSHDHGATTRNPAGNVLGAVADGRRCTSTATPTVADGAAVDRRHVGGSQPHTNFQPYLCVDFIISLFGIFPSARPEETTPWPIRSSPRSASSRSTSRPRAGRCATGSSCRSRRTPRCSRCSAPPTAATASRNFALPDLQGRAPMHPGQGPGLSLHDLGETGGSETVTLLETEIPSHTHALHGRRSRGEHDAPSRQRSLAPVGRRARSTRRPQRRPGRDGRPGARAGRRRPAAQQHAAVPDASTSASRCRASSRRGRDRTMQRTVDCRRAGSFGWVARRRCRPDISPIADADLPFLARVYASTRAEELAATPLTDDVKGGLSGRPVSAAARALPEILSQRRLAGDDARRRGHRPPLYRTLADPASHHRYRVAARTSRQGFWRGAAARPDGRGRRLPARRSRSMSRSSIRRCGSTAASASPPRKTRASTI